jgi:hypothetical protein
MPRFVPLFAPFQESLELLAQLLHLAAHLLHFAAYLLDVARAGPLDTLFKRSRAGLLETRLKLKFSARPVIAGSYL